MHCMLYSLAAIRALQGPGLPCEIAREAWWHHFISLASVHCQVIVRDVWQDIWQTLYRQLTSSNKMEGQGIVIVDHSQRWLYTWYYIWCCSFDTRHPPEIQVETKSLLWLQLRNHGNSFQNWERTSNVIKVTPLLFFCIKRTTMSTPTLFNMHVRYINCLCTVIHLTCLTVQISRITSLIST